MFKEQILISYSSEAKKSKSKCWQIWCFVSALFLLPRQPSCCVLTWQRGVRTLWDLFCKDIYSMRASPSWPTHLPKTSLPNIIFLGVKISKYGMWGDMTIQTVAPRNTRRNFTFTTCLSLGIWRQASLMRSYESSESCFNWYLCGF